jgi:hypothetical protein
MAKKKSERPNTLNQLKETAVKSVAPTTDDKAAERPRHLDRLTADLPEGLKEEIQTIAKGYDCTMSDIAAYFILIGLKSYRDGALDIEPMLKPIRSLNARFGLSLDFYEPEK